MKKNLLFVLMVFILAGGIFAQEGSWSISGGFDTGVRFDLEGLPYADGDTPNATRLMGKATGWFEPYDYYLPVSGKLGLSYNREGLNIGLDFSTHSDPVTASVTYNGENGKIVMSNELMKVLSLTSNIFEHKSSGYNNQKITVDSKSTEDLGYGNGPDKDNIGRLWASYLILDLVYIEAAYAGDDKQFWFSDVTGAGNINRRPDNYDPKALYEFNYGETFTKVDHHNYLVIDARLPFGLSAGIFMPHLFADENSYEWTGAALKDNAHSYHYTKNLYKKPQNGWLFYDDVWMQSVFGVKYDVSPIEIAAQYKIFQSGVYIGGKFSSGPIVAGLSFNGLLNPISGGIGGETMTGTTWFKVGASADYNAGALNAGIGVWYGLEGETGIEALAWPIRQAGKAAKGSKKSVDSEIKRLVTNVYDDYKNYQSQFGFEPYVNYNILPSYLRGELKLGFHFDDKTAVTKYKGSYKSSFKTKYGITLKDVDETGHTFHWMIQPSVFFNFAGNGAGSYYGMGNGLLVRYRFTSTELGRNTAKATAATGIPSWDRTKRSPGGNDHTPGVQNYSNALDIAFKFAF